MTTAPAEPVTRTKPTATPVGCPSCRSTQTRFLGDSVFAAWAECPEVASLRAESGGLHRCRHCDLVFRAPVPSPAALARAYAAIPVGSWSYQRPRWWDWSAEAIRRFAPNPRVLDVGCFRGDFLSSLGESVQKFGVEPNPAAARHATANGVEIIGQSATDDLSAHRGRFGTVVLMDVIEHVEDPVGVLRELSPLLAPGGIFIILTGNSTAWWVRRALPHYWYMSFPIHLVYLGERYLRWLEGRLGLVRRDWRVLAHESAGRRQRLRELGKALGMAVWHGWLARSFLGGVAGRVWPFRRLRQLPEPPRLMSLPDHFWAVLQLKTP